MIRRLRSRALPIPPTTARYLRCHVHARAVEGERDGGHHEPLASARAAAEHLDARLGGLDREACDTECGGHRVGVAQVAS